jgi:dolichyl-phosphate beta-glucosyltransferase
VPCFNEAERFSSEGFAAFFARPDVRLVFVDDGSSDATSEVLARFCEAHDRAVFLSLPENRGKGEAVRAGMLRAIEDGASIVGYTDADLATPVDEMLRLLDALETTDADAVIGARVALLGVAIDRNASRHYLGRLFASCVSLVLRERVYDTQCGAKLFRALPALDAALVDPFLSRWAFDVELLGRLLAAGVRVVEVPLKHWTDVPGSKLRPGAMLGAAADLLRIDRDLRERRARAPLPGEEHGEDQPEQRKERGPR